MIRTFCFFIWLWLISIIFLASFISLLIDIFFQHLCWFLHAFVFFTHMYLTNTIYGNFHGPNFVFVKFFSKDIFVRFFCFLRQITNHFKFLRFLAGILTNGTRDWVNTHWGGYGNPFQQQQRRCYLEKKSKISNSYSCFWYYFSIFSITYSILFWISCFIFVILMTFLKFFSQTYCECQTSFVAKIESTRIIHVQSFRYIILHQRHPIWR